MERFTVDRVEGAFAVLECGDGSMRDVALSELPDGAREGSALVLDGGAWSLDPEGERERRERIRAKMDRLFKR